MPAGLRTRRHCASASLPRGLLTVASQPVLWPVLDDGGRFCLPLRGQSRIRTGFPLAMLPKRSKPARGHYIVCRGAVKALYVAYGRNVPNWLRTNGLRGSSGLSGFPQRPTGRKPVGFSAEIDSAITCQCPVTSDFVGLNRRPKPDALAKDWPAIDATSSFASASGLFSQHTESSLTRH